jgi:hypothetical protein
LLDLVDAIRAMLASIEATGHEGDGDHADLIARLTHVCGGQAAPNLPRDMNPIASP